jgi:hypothetical protein
MLGAPIVLWGSYELVVDLESRILVRISDHWVAGGQGNSVRPAHGGGTANERTSAGYGPQPSIRRRQSREGELWKERQPISSTRSNLKHKDWRDHRQAPHHWE